MNTNLPPVNERFTSAATALMNVERVTVDDVQRVADALALDVAELTNAVIEQRREAAATANDCRACSTDDCWYCERPQGTREAADGSEHPVCCCGRVFITEHGRIEAQS